MLNTEMVQKLWNIERDSSWPGCRAMTPKRAQAVRLRIKEVPDLEEWRFVIRQLKRDRWWERKGTWRPCIDWLLRAGKLIELLEKYEAAQTSRPEPAAPLKAPVRAFGEYRTCSRCGFKEAPDNTTSVLWIEGRFICEACIKDDEAIPF